MVVRRIVSIFIFASSIRSLIRNPKVGIAFGRMAKISEYFGMKTVSNVGLLGVLLSFIACCNDSRHCSKNWPYDFNVRMNITL